MLYEHARACGANAREGHEAVNIEQNGPRDTRLDVRTDDGRSYRIQARYLVDASGRDTFLAAKRKLRRKNNRIRAQRSSATSAARMRARARTRATSACTGSSMAGCG